MNRGINPKSTNFDDDITMNKAMTLPLNIRSVNRTYSSLVALAGVLTMALLIYTYELFTLGLAKNSYALFLGIVCFAWALPFLSCNKNKFQETTIDRERIVVRWLNSAGNPTTQPVTYPTTDFSEIGLVRTSQPYPDRVCLIKNLSKDEGRFSAKRDKSFRKICFDIPAGEDPDAFVKALGAALGLAPSDMFDPAGRIWKKFVWRKLNVIQQLAVLIVAFWALIAGVLFCVGMSVWRAVHG